MGRSTTAGIYPSPDGTYEVDAVYRKQRLRRRGFARHADAQSWLIGRKAQISAGMEPGQRPAVTFDMAAAHHLDSKINMPSWETDRYLLAPLAEMIGSLTLDEISNDALAPFIRARQAAGRKTKTINSALSIVQTICNRAATVWRHPNGMTWLAHAPTIARLEQFDQRPPRPISWAEQRRLIPELPAHLARMALFDLNTGLREQALCNLRWEWEARVMLRPGLTVSVFVVPRRFVKGRKRERILVCNSVAQDIIERQRGLHPERVFTFAQRTTRKGVDPKHRAVGSMNNSAWQAARVRAGIPDLHVHDLRHTVGMRLRDVGVSERTQNDILWHTDKGMSNHYAVAQVREIYDALERISRPGEEGESQNLLAVVRAVQMRQFPQNSPSQRKTA